MPATQVLIQTPVNIVLADGTSVYSGTLSGFNWNANVFYYNNKTYQLSSVSWDISNAYYSVIVTERTF